MFMKIIIGLTFLIILGACNNQSDIISDAKKVYNSREELIREFNSITIWRRGDSAFLLQVYNDKKTNGYLFRGDNGLKLQSDTASFQLNEIERFKNIDTLDQVNAIGDLLTTLLNKMNALEIREVSSDDKALGIDLKFFLNSGGVVFYVKDLSSVINVEWKKYIKGSKMMDEHWYYNER